MLSLDENPLLLAGDFILGAPKLGYGAVFQRLQEGFKQSVCVTIAIMSVRSRQTIG